MIDIEYYPTNSKHSQTFSIENELLEYVRLNLTEECLNYTNCYDGWRYNERGYLINVDDNLISRVTLRIINNRRAIVVRDDINECQALGVIQHLGFGTIKDNAGYKWVKVNDEIVSDLQNLIKLRNPYESGCGELSMKINSVIIHNNKHQRYTIEELVNLLEIEYATQPIFD